MRLVERPLTNDAVEVEAVFWHSARWCRAKLSLRVQEDVTVFTHRRNETAQDFDVGTILELPRFPVLIPEAEHRGWQPQTHRIRAKNIEDVVVDLGENLQRFDHPRRPKLQTERHSKLSVCTRRDAGHEGGAKVDRDAVWDLMVQRRKDTCP